MLEHAVDHLALDAVTLRVFIVCGRPTLDTAITPYIVHGTDAPQGRWPWQVAILKDGSFICGGSLVDDVHVVTAAHCIESVRRDSLYIIQL